jgi:cell division septum initiation protein DivIVA
MAWQSTDLERIRKYLGYPVVASSVQAIASRQTEVESISPDAVTTAQGFLNELRKIEETIAGKRSYAAAASHSTAGSSTDYFPGRTLGDLREEGSRYARELAELMGLIVMRDIFAVAAAPSARLRRS